jgi:hypothetical protein
MVCLSCVGKGLVLRPYFLLINQTYKLLNKNEDFKIGITLIRRSWARTRLATPGYSATAAPRASLQPEFRP